MAANSETVKSEFPLSLSRYNLLHIFGIGLRVSCYNHPTIVSVICDHSINVPLIFSLNKNTLITCFI